MAFIYLLLLFLLFLVCAVLLYALPALVIGLLLVALVWLASVLGQYLTRLLPHKAKNVVLISSLLLWAGLWVLTYYAPTFKQLTPPKKTTLVCCAPC